ncbi:MAG: RNA pseudouridine synthase [Bacilli bacterium]
MDGFVPNLCHRLDRDTTGLIIAAKNLKTLREINSCFTNGLIIKKYIALVYGDIPRGKVKLESYIMKNEKTNLMEIDKENIFNKKIITEYELIKSYGNYSKIKIRIYTGKKHQIRVHMATINHPILADSKYNKINSLNFKNLCLQANEIKFELPSNHFLSYLNEIEFKLSETKFT